MSKHASRFAFILVLALARAAGAQGAEPTAPAAPVDPVPPPLPEATDPVAQPPATAPSPTAAPPSAAPPGAGAEPPVAPRIESRAPPQAIAEPTEQPEEMSEGRRIVVAYNTGFQWGLSPGVVFVGGKTSFFLGLRLGYGFDTGTVIVVPGVRLSGYFSDPNVYVGMPVTKLVFPIDRFAPFVEGGAGVGHVSGFDVGNVAVAGQTGVALFAGLGFVMHFTARFGLGVEGTYQTITGTGFDGFGIGPILALAF